MKFQTILWTLLALAIVVLVLYYVAANYLLPWLVSQALTSQGMNNSTAQLLPQLQGQQSFNIFNGTDSGVVPPP